MKRYALVDHIGHKPYKLEIVEEYDKGFILRTGLRDSPATEWFAKECVQGSVFEVESDLANATDNANLISVLA